MFKNYYYLLKLAEELNAELAGCSFSEAYTQEKGTLIIHTPNKNNTSRHIFLCSEQNFPNILIKPEHHKAKKNVLLFFKEYFPSTLIRTEIAKSDRIIRFVFESFNLLFVVHGNLTNILIEQNRKIINSFRKLETKDIHKLEELIGRLEYIFEFEEFKSELFNSFTIILNEEIKNIRRIFPQISKEILLETEIRLKQFSNTSEALQSAVKSIFYEPAVVAFDSLAGKIRLFPESYHIFSPSAQYGKFNKFSDAVRELLYAGYREDRINSLRKKIGNALESEFSRLNQRMNKLKNRLESGSKDTYYNKVGNLLLGNLQSIYKGMDSITLTDETGAEIKIELDVKLLPYDNAKRYFEKSKDEKRAFKESEDLFDETERQLERLKKYSLIYGEENNAGELEKLLRVLNPEREKIMINDREKMKVREFVIDGKYKLFVGRDSKSNDYLSIKFAKQNDLWFHARGVPGSHTLLRNDNPKETIPKPVIKIAASVAAFFSKAKTAGIVPVSYTYAKYVYKKKGMEPGQVFLSKEEVIHVKPEIPSGCISENDDDNAE